MTINLAELNRLFHFYSPVDIVSAEKNEDAFASDVFDLKASNGRRYFMKILRSQRPEAIANEVAIQQRILASGLASPQYLEITPGNHIGTLDGARFLLSDYIPGVSPRIVTPKLTRSLGEVLAQIHDSLEDMTIPQSEMQWLTPEKVAHDLAPYRGIDRPVLDELIDHGSVIFDNSLPTAVIHGDLWLQNVFAEDDRVTTVFDFETAENTVRIIDLARTYTSIRFNSDYTMEQAVDYLAEGYDTAASKKLTDEERRDIYPAIAYVCGACATWHAVHGTRYRDPYIQLGREVMQRGSSII